MDPEGHFNITVFSGERKLVQETEKGVLAKDALQDTNTPGMAQAYPLPMLSFQR